jgi:hypothetical protein
MPAIVARFAASEKPRGLVAINGRRTYILGMHENNVAARSALH